MQQLLFIYVLPGFAFDSGTGLENWIGFFIGEAFVFGITLVPFALISLVVSRYVDQKWGRICLFISAAALLCVQVISVFLLTGH